MGKLIMNKNKILWNKALLKIPSGNSFLSKNPSRYKSKDWPEYFSKSKGSIVWDLNGKKYYDFAFMGVGTNILGYTNYRVDNAVIKKIKKGNMSTLNCPEEVMFAEKLLKLHPWAKMAKFAKTGADANAIAIRLSRAFNKKNKIIVCGYHGWHDWYLSAKYSKDNYLDTHLFPSLKTEGVPKIFISISNILKIFFHSDDILFPTLGRICQLFVFFIISIVLIPAAGPILSVQNVLLIKEF